MSAFHPLQTLAPWVMIGPVMIKRSRIAVIWRRTLVVFAAVQAIGFFVFAYDLRAIRAGEVAESESRLVLAYVAFLAFSCLVLWFMHALRVRVERSHGSDR